MASVRIEAPTPASSYADYSYNSYVASGGASSSIAQLAGPASADSSTTTRFWHAHVVASGASAVAAAYVDANAHRRANARGRAASAIAASPAARLAS